VDTHIELAGGTSWAGVVPRHHRLRLTCSDTRGAGANVSMLLYAEPERLERLNIPDTLKAQLSARIAAPLVLMSDRGRALCSVVGSSLDWHDAITGHAADSHLARYGPSSYAADRNGWRRSTRDLLLLELARRGLSERDLHACVNWFAKVAPAGDERGSLAFVPGHAADGDWVELRADTDVLVVLASAPHPLDPSPTWAPADITLRIAPGAAPGPYDASRLHRPESGRALAATERSLG
jgi:urea carboxylase-associated protein 2